MSQRRTTFDVDVQCADGVRVIKSNVDTAEERGKTDGRVAGLSAWLAVLLIRIFQDSPVQTLTASRLRGIIVYNGEFESIRVDGLYNRSCL